MTDQNCFGWTIGLSENPPNHRKPSTLTRKALFEVDRCMNQSLGLKIGSQRATLPKKPSFRKPEFSGNSAARSLRTQELRRRSSFSSTSETRNSRQPGGVGGSSAVRKVCFSRFFSDPHLIENDFEYRSRLNSGLYEPPVTKFSDFSELSRARRKRKNSRVFQNAEYGAQRRVKFAENRYIKSDRILDGMNDLEAKLVNMSTKNGNLILLAWSLNEEFQMIEKNVESLMEDMKSLHQDLKDLRFANDLLYLLKGELNRVSLKRWPFMILNENFCENPQQEFNLIV